MTGRTRKLLLRAYLQVHGIPCELRYAIDLKSFTVWRGALTSPQVRRPKACYKQAFSDAPVRKKSAQPPSGIENGLS